MFTKKPTYLDSASTTQTPGVVLSAMNDYYKNYRANVHRGIYDASVKATEGYEGARKKVAEFINTSPEEIIFTSGTTHSLNQLAYSLSPRLSHRDNIVLTRAEHHANLIPWQQMAKHYGFEIRFLDIDPTNYLLLTTNLHPIIDANTKIVSFSLVSNVLGTIAPAKEIIDAAKQVRAITIIDAAQAAAHMPIDVQSLDCEFLAFSGHKMYGPTGIGVLYGKKEMLGEHLEPFFFGGEMVTSVSYEKSEWNSIPHKFEAGTPNIAGAIGLGAAIDYIQGTGWKKTQMHEKEILFYALEKLSPIVKIINKDTENRLGVISFVIDGIHPHDVAQILANESISVRAGFHCAEPLHRHLGLNQGTVRISLGMYNTKKDIDKLVKGIEKVIKMFNHPLQATS